jgi:membrane-associated phospholipid phosphatase
MIYMIFLFFSIIYKMTPSDIPLIFSQTSAQFIPIYAIIYGLISLNYYLIFLGIFLFMNEIINLGLKKIFQVIYDVFTKKAINLLGIGGRPKNAVNCGSMPTIKSYCNLSKSFGMPSGHSQQVWFFFGFLLLYLIKQLNDEDDKDDKKYKKIFIGVVITIFLCISIFISVSRVYVGCHTIQQVIIGGLFGFMFGCLGFLLTNYILTKSIF